MKTPSNSLSSWVALCVGLLGGCASGGTSEQLKTARNSYEQASQGPAAQYAPEELLEARNILQDAEAADDDSAREQQLAYLADRQARAAAAEGSIRENERRISVAKEKYVTLQEQGRVAAERGLSETQEQLTETQKAQKEAEARAASAMASLEELGRVKEEANETILTLSGQVIFETGQADIMPVAEERLDAVARALKQLDASQKIVVEGHTDAQGSEESNEKLSKERAEAVRDYLVEQGVNEAQLTAVGRGEAEPIANNETAEGRANNRRVELVIQKPDVSKE